MKQVIVKAVVITNGTSYIIHGCSDETYQEMFKRMAPIWDFDPSHEDVHCIEMDLRVPEYEQPVEITPTTYGPDDIKS